MPNANVCPYPRGQAPTWRTTKREGYRECRSVPGMLGTAQTRDRLPGQTQRTAGNAPCMTIFCAWRGSEGRSPRCCLPHPATRAAGPEALCVSPPVPQAQGNGFAGRGTAGKLFRHTKGSRFPEKAAPFAGGPERTPQARPWRPLCINICKDVRLIARPMPAQSLIAIHRQISPLRGRYFPDSRRAERLPSR